MTSPRSSYGGGYYAAPSYPDTPIYDMLVAERGTPQIAPIRVSSPMYDTGGGLPALPPAALPPGPAAQQPPAPQYGGYQQHAPPVPHQQMTQPALPQLPQPALPQAPSPLQQAPAAQVPPQAHAPRGYAAPPMQQPQPYPQAPQQPQPQQMRPVAPRPPVPRQMPSPYEDPYGGQQYPGRGY